MQRRDRSRETGAVTAAPPTRQTAAEHRAISVDALREPKRRVYPPVLDVHIEVLPRGLRFLVDVPKEIVRQNDHRHAVHAKLIIVTIRGAVGHVDDSVRALKQHLVVEHDLPASLLYTSDAADE